MATRPFDVSKFRKSITKSIEGLSIGFRDPTDWISTGNYALNYRISGDFKKGIPLGKVTVFAGQSGCLPETAVVRINVNGNTKNITVAELKQLYESDQYHIEIDTPDGFQPITQWFDKGKLPMVKITTGSGLQTTCAHNHLLQYYEDEIWVPAINVNIGDELLTTHGRDTVTSVTHVDDELCYDFTVNHPNHRYWGDGFSSHNSGKSFLCSGNVVRNAQDQGIYVILIDTENALDETWLQALGVDTDESKLLKLNMAMIDDVSKTITEFVKEYKQLPEQDRPKVLFVIDSLGMLLTPTDVNQFEAGDLKGDMGRKPKALTALVRNCVNMFGSLNIGLLATNHTYASQDMFDPDDKISGGQGFIYASSIVVAMQKRKLKEDEDGNKVTDVTGIRAACKVMKTRYNKPFENVEIKIPYDSGMSPTSGLFDMFDGMGLLVKEGNSYVYKAQDGNIIKKFRKAWEKNDDGCLDIVMDDVMATKDKPIVITPDETPGEEL